jgi:hypothetical protein
MALTATTIAGALSASGTRVALTSATSVVAGSIMKIDDEFVRVAAINGTAADLVRGINGTAAVAHAALAPCVHSADGADFWVPVAPRVYSYGAAGAITVAPGIHIIGCGASGAQAMTLADPAADQMGIQLTIVSASAQAHTVTLTTGYLGTNASDVFTFAGALGHSITLVAAKGVWAHVGTSLAADESAGVAVA